jgi:hypothetical protein
MFLNSGITFHPLGIRNPAIKSKVHAFSLENTSSPQLIESKYQLYGLDAPSNVSEKHTHTPVLLSFPVQIQFRAVMLQTENRVQQPAPSGN